jgi:3-oxosteroid 1-dehydrogenase
MDVVVVGSGAAGLVCALVAAVGDLRVLVVEKSEKLGGTSAMSGDAG